jgi:hypothetical protein
MVLQELAVGLSLVAVVSVFYIKRKSSQHEEIMGHYIEEINALKEMVTTNIMNLESKITSSEQKFMAELKKYILSEETKEPERHEESMVVEY